MSEQTATPKRGGTRRSAQAVAGVAGAVACLGIGWAVGVRTTGAHAIASQATTAPTLTQPDYPAIPREWDDEGPGVQWGTVPGTGVTPAQPGTGVVAPSTGSGGSSVAVAPTTNAVAPTTNAVAPTTNAVAPTTTTVTQSTTTGTTGGLP